MSTADKREELEAAAWMVPGISTADVDRILNRADRYASAFGADLLDQIVSDRRKAGRRAVLAGELAEADRYRRTA